MMGVQRDEGRWQRMAAGLKINGSMMANGPYNF